MWRKLERFALLSAGVFLSSGLSSHAFTLSSSVEAITIPSVGAAFQTVNFDNTYTSPVVACSYTLPSDTDPPATVRLTGVGSTSRQVRIQQFENSSVVTPGTVSCLVAETGANILPDGRRIEARTVASTNAHGTSTAIGFTPTGMVNASSLFSGFSNPIALGQVMTFNDARGSVFHANDCENRDNPPFQSGFADGICVTKHIGQIAGTRSSETLGIIVIETGAGSVEGAAYDVQLGPDSVLGVGNAPPYNYSLSGSFEFAVVTLGGEASLGLAIDEDQISDSERSHTTENVAYFAARRTPLFTASKTVDCLSIAETLSLNYTIEIENTGQLDQTGFTLTDTLPDGSAASLTGPNGEHRHRWCF